jgi:hypothetical protein
MLKKVLYLNTNTYPNGVLNANTLKFIAVIAMILDHCAIVFVPEEYPLNYALHAMGRLTAPIMCFFIAEGYHYTSNLKRYMGRLLIAAVLSHIPHNLCFGHSIIEFWKATSVMWSLFLGLVALAVYRTETIHIIWRVLAVAGCCILAYPGNWNYIAVLWILVFGMHRDHPWKKWIGFTVISLLYVAQFYIHGSDSVIWLRFFVLCAIPVLMAYNHTLGRKSKVMQLGYYLIYPVHLLLLYFIKAI